MVRTVGRTITDSLYKFVDMKRLLSLLLAMLPVLLAIAQEDLQKGAVPWGEKHFGALACAKAHVTAGTALVKRFRLALRSPQELKFSGTPL